MIVYRTSRVGALCILLLILAPLGPTSSDAHSGGLDIELRSRWGLSHDVVVCGVAGDNAAAACGIGASRNGDGFVSIGTSGVVLIARDKYAPAPETAVHTFCHAVPDRWYQTGVMLSATDSLNWLSRIAGAGPADLIKLAFPK